MPVDAFEEVTIVDDDGVVRRGWIPHFTTCTDPDKHRKATRAAAPIPDRTRQPRAVIGMRLLSEVEAHGGRPREATFEVRDRTVVVTFPRSPVPSPRGPTPQPRQADLGFDGEPRPNGPTDVGGYVEESHWSRAASRYAPSDGDGSDPDL